MCAAGIPNTYGAAPPDYFTEWEFQYDKLLTTHLLAVIFSDVDDDGLNNLSWNPYKVFVETQDNK